MLGSRLHWSLVAISSASAVALAFFLVPPFAGLLFVRHWGYFVILAAFLAFCASLVQTMRRDGGWSWRALDLRMVLVAAVAAVLWQFQEPHGFKVLMDELVLNAVAMSMHFDREAFVPLKTHDIDGLYLVLGGVMDKRPLFFPFLLSLLHDVSGYRPENVFVLNALLSFLLLVAVGHLGRLLGNSKPAGILGVLLLAGLPLLSLNATSGGFDILNILMIVVMVLLGIQYLEQPTADRQNNLVLATVLLAQTRYESALFVGAAAVILGACWIRRRALLFSWGLVAAPLMLITIPLQQKIFTINAGYWQAQGTGTPVDPRFFFDNLGHAMNFLFTVDDFSLASLILSIGGLVATLFALVFMVRRWRRTIHSAPLFAFWIVALVILGNTGLLLCYFWGQFDDYLATRLALPLMTLFCLSCALVLGRWLKPGIAWFVAYAITVAWIWGWAMPVSTNARATHAFLSYQEIVWEREFVARNEEAAFFVMHSSLPAITQRRAGVPIEVLTERAEELGYHLEAGTYDAVYVFQRLVLDPKIDEFKVAPEDALGPEFILEPLEHRRFKPLYAMRLSRITGVDLSRALPHPPDWQPRFPPFRIVPEERETPEATFLREYLDMLP